MKTWECSQRNRRHFIPGAVMAGEGFVCGSNIFGGKKCGICENAGYNMNMTDGKIENGNGKNVEMMTHL